MKDSMKLAIYRKAYEAAKAEHPEWGIPDVPDNATAEELDKACGMKASVDTAIAAFEELRQANMYLGDKPLYDGEFQTLQAMHRVHKNWVKNNFDAKYEQRPNTRFQFASFGAIGWEEAAKDLTFVKPVADAFGYTLDMEKLKADYDKFYSTPLMFDIQFDKEHGTHHVLKSEARQLNVCVGKKVVSYDDKMFVDAVESSPNYQDMSKLADMLIAFKSGTTKSDKSTTRELPVIESEMDSEKQLGE